MSLLLTLKYFTPCSSGSIVNFEQVNAGWDAPRSKYEEYITGELR